MIYSVSLFQWTNFATLAFITSWVYITQILSHLWMPFLCACHQEARIWIKNRRVAVKMSFSVLQVTVGFTYLGFPTCSKLTFLPRHSETWNTRTPKWILKKTNVNKYYLSLKMHSILNHHVKYLAPIILSNSAAARYKTVHAIMDTGEGNQAIKNWRANKVLPLHFLGWGHTKGSIRSFYPVWVCSNQHWSHSLIFDILSNPLPVK